MQVRIFYTYPFSLVSPTVVAKNYFFPAVAFVSPEQIISIYRIFWIIWSNQLPVLSITYVDAYKVRKPIFFL